jgi:hypothetical protein
MDFCPTYMLRARRITLQKIALVFLVVGA